MRHVRLGGFDVEIPETHRERARGLLGRDALRSDQALLLLRCRSVHTFGMRFAIDVVSLDRAGRPLRAVTMKPWRVLVPRMHVRHVLEVAAGRGREAVLATERSDALRTVLPARPTGQS